MKFQRAAWGVAIILVLSGCAATLTGDPENVKEVKIVEGGIYKSEASKSPAYRNSTAGKVYVMEDGPAMMEATDTIPGKPGLSFGFKYIIVTDDQGPVKYPVMYRVTYPAAMVNPRTGESARNWEFHAFSKANTPVYQGFNFSEQYEILPGEWVFEIFVGSNVGRKSFIISK